MSSNPGGAVGFKIAQQAETAKLALQHNYIATQNRPVSARSRRSD